MITQFEPENTQFIPENEYYHGSGSQKIGGGNAASGYSGPVQLLQPGRNVKQFAMAKRASMLIDGETYFNVLADSLSLARHRILIINPNFDGNFFLDPRKGWHQPTFGELLRIFVERHVELEIFILISNSAPPPPAKTAFSRRFHKQWQDHPRIRIHFDTHCRSSASHHQKIVAIDDSLAFVGGMDLSPGQWDMSDHAPGNPYRSLDDGMLSNPVHGVQAMVDGDAALAIANIAYERWQMATGERLSSFPLRGIIWPPRCPVDFWLTHIGIAACIPATGQVEDRTILANLTGDLLRSAREVIYIEAHYFTARHLRGVFRDILARTQGPDIIIVTPCEINGTFKRFLMEADRRRLLRILKRWDVYCPALAGPQEDALLFRSNVMIIDDRHLRIGSADLNNRSMGFDSECDIVIDGETDELRSVIACCRARLLAEHLQSSSADVKKALRAKGKLSEAIAMLNRSEGRRLRPFQPAPGALYFVPGTTLIDPQKSYGFFYQAKNSFRHGRYRSYLLDRAPHRIKTVLRNLTVLLPSRQKAVRKHMP